MSILNNTITLWGNQVGDKSDAPTLPSGTHRYPFSFRLPTNDTLPSSYNANKGVISYYAEAFLDVSWSIDPSVKVPFTVMGIIDIANPAFNDPVKQMGMKDDCGCFCNGGPISGEVILSKSGFLLTDTIDANIKINNNSPAAVTATCMRLMRLSEHHTNGK